MGNASEKQETKKLLTAAEIMALGNVTGRREVYVPEWGGDVWVWGTTRTEDMFISDQQRVAIETGGDQATLEAASRRRTATMLQCIRDSGEDNAKPLFDSTAWDYLEGSPTAVVDLICNVVSELDASGPETQGELTDFFGIASGMVGCWKHIASHCDACIDCPKNSPTTCPLQRLTSLLPPTASSKNESTPGSATDAPKKSDEDKPA